MIYRRSRGRTTGGDFSLLCVAPEAVLTYVEPYLRSVAFPADDASTEEGVAAADTATHAEDDLIAVVCPTDPRTGGAGLPGPARAVLPLRVHLVADLRADGENAPAVSRRERRRQRRRVLDHGYDYAVSTRSADFEHFYDRMHLPTMRSRHGAHARSTARSAAHDTLFREGFLFQLRAGGQAVAAVLCHVEGEVCHARLVGWLDGDPVHLEREALKTANHLLLEWARAEGFARVDFQGCEPFVRKGSFQSKRHLGTTAELPRGELGEARIVLACGRDSAAVRDLLVANPVIAVGADRALEPWYFTDGTRPARTDIPYACAGLGASRTVDLDAGTGSVGGAARDGAPVGGELVSP